MNDKREAQASLFLFSWGRNGCPSLAHSGGQLAQRLPAALLGGLQLQ
ncbi:hypothetical protein Aerorivi_02385 [Aeromonas rivipollensis]|jgi:hypothetical protein